MDCTEMHKAANATVQVCVSRQQQLCHPVNSRFYFYVPSLPRDFSDSNAAFAKEMVLFPYCGSPVW